MWRLLRTELAYNWILFICLTAIVPFAAYFRIHPFAEDIPVAFFVFWSAFMVLQFWTIQRNKERRERRWFSLPVSVWKRAVVRIGIIVATAFLMHALYFLCQWMLNFHQRPEFLGLIQPLGILVLIFSVYFLFRDTAVMMLREGRLRWLTPERSKMFIKILLFTVLLINVYLFIMASRGSHLDFIVKFVRFFKYSALFTTNQGLIEFSLFSCAVSALTILSYCTRKRYTE